MAVARKTFWDNHDNPQKGNPDHAQAVGQSTKGKYKKNPASILDLSSRTVRKLLQRINPGCSRFQCGWKEGIGDIHHINGRKVADANGHWNLSYLCPNCHRLVHEGKVPKDELVTIQTQLGETWFDHYYG